METTPLLPGSLCRIVGTPDRRLVEHVAPCSDGYPTGTVTDLYGRVFTTTTEG